MAWAEWILPIALLLPTAVGWWFVVRRIRRGEEPVPFEPHPQVPWDGLLAMSFVVIYFGTRVLVVALAAPPPGEAIVNAAFAEVAAPTVDVAQTVRDLRAGTAAGLLTIIAVLVGLKLFVPHYSATAAGLDVSRLGYDVRLGLFGFIVIVPPALVLQQLLSKVVGESRHPLIEGWKAGGGQDLLVWSILAAVVAAPLVEELIFRGVIQGWLERLHLTTTQPPDTIAAAAATDASDPRLPRPWSPILVSAAVFALIHAGSGPDPVPIFFLAVGLGYLYRQTHRIWPGVVVHALLNAFSTSILWLGVQS